MIYFLTQKSIFRRPTYAMIATFRRPDRDRSMVMARHRILVIEDDVETAEQLVDFLGTSGYSIDLAVDGDEGLRRARSGEYTVITIDRMLPGIDGITII